MKILCVIPARAGSKRIPRKNRKKFIDRPIIEYAIKSAEDAAIFNRIDILTDDKWIYDKYPKLTIKRYSESATDDATLTDALLSMGENKLNKYEYICLLLPTALFIDHNDILTAYETMVNNSLDGVLTLTKYRHPVQRSFKIVGNNASMVDDYAEFIPTKDLISNYHDSGQFYWLKTSSFLEQRKIFMANMGYHELQFAVDIDTDDDWKIAESFIKGKQIVVEEPIIEDPITEEPKGDNYAPQ